VERDQHLTFTKRFLLLGILEQKRKRKGHARSCPVCYKDEAMAVSQTDTPRNITTYSNTAEMLIFISPSFPWVSKTIIRNYCAGDMLIRVYLLTVINSLNIAIGWCIRTQLSQIRLVFCSRIQWSVSKDWQSYTSHHSPECWDAASYPQLLHRCKAYSLKRMQGNAPSSMAHGLPWKVRKIGYSAHQEIPDL
jgi:hypothetical protein